MGQWRAPKTRHCYAQTLATIILGQMRIFLSILFVSVSLIGTLAQERVVISGKDGQNIDTLDNRSIYSIKGDTLTRFIRAKSHSPDQCSSFSLIREQHTREGKEFRHLRTRKIVIMSTCSSLLTDDNAYCLQLVDFKLNNGTAKIVLADSNDRKLRTKIKVDNNFEIRLKAKVDKFIDRQDCNGVRIE